MDVRPICPKHRVFLRHGICPKCGWRQPISRQSDSLQRWQIIDFMTGEVLASSLKHYFTLDAARRSAIKYFRRFMSDIDPDDVLIKLSYVNTGMYSLFPMSDLEWDHFCFKDEQWNLLKQLAEEDIETKELDTVQKLRIAELAQIIGKRK